MANGNDIKKYTAAELAELRARDGSRSDYARLQAKPEAELEQDIANDPDWAGVPDDWFETATAVPSSKKLLSIRLDPEVVDWFKEQGPGYQTRINAVLRAFVERMRSKAA